MTFHIQLWLTFNRFTQHSLVRCNKSFSQSHWSETFIWLSSSNESNSLTVFWLAIDNFKVKWFETTAALVDNIKVDLPQSQSVPSAFSNRIHRWDSSSSEIGEGIQNFKMYDWWVVEDVRFPSFSHENVSSRLFVSCHGNNGICSWWWCVLQHFWFIQL